MTGAKALIGQHGQMVSVRGVQVRSTIRTIPRVYRQGSSGARLLLAPRAPMKAPLRCIRLATIIGSLLAAHSVCFAAHPQTSGERTELPCCPSLESL